MPTLVGVVNGPEDACSGWHQVNWRRAEREVRRLRQRIFTASAAGDLAKVRWLQRLMLDSRSNALVSVRRVTERNAGRLTAGVDGEVVLTPEAKLALADAGRVSDQGTARQVARAQRSGLQRGQDARRRPRCGL
jgi:RNA-directed DNA polymerase